MSTQTQVVEGAVNMVFIGRTEQKSKKHIHLFPSDPPGPKISACLQVTDQDVNAYTISRSHPMNNPLNEI